VDPASFFAASRVVIVAGKGGVGKTVVSAALARAAAIVGLDTVLVEIDGRASTHRSFDTEPLDYHERELWRAPGSGRVRGRSITADRALVEYLHDHGMARIADRLQKSGALEVVATATPGLKDLLVLGKIKQLALTGHRDLVVVDAPASGHAIGFLRAPSVLLDLAGAGPIHHQAREAMAMLTDATRCQVVLVTIPEETPVDEAIETAYALEDEVGVALGPIVVNGVYEPLTGLERPPRTGDADVRAALTAAAELRRLRQLHQEAERQRLAGALPLEQVVLPFLFTPTIGASESAVLAEAILDGIRRLADHAVTTHG
jgi:anion-transporting  ArsA/GET3 family ATPase